MLKSLFLVAFVVSALVFVSANNADNESSGSRGSDSSCNSSSHRVDDDGDCNEDGHDLVTQVSSSSSSSDASSSSSSQNSSSSSNNGKVTENSSSSSSASDASASSSSQSSTTVNKGKAVQNSSSSSSSSSASSSSASQSSTSTDVSDDDCGCDEPKCGKNEEFSECTQAICRHQYCCDTGKPNNCKDPDDCDCIKGCVCKVGYLRNDKGTCVPKDKCHNKCSRPNEVYDLCPGNCPLRRCGIDDRVILCQQQPQVGDPDCPPPACRCQDGFYRNDDGDCVTWDECPQTCGDNEFYSNCTNGGCHGARKCSEKGTPIRCVKIDPKNCKKGCICTDGYLRDEADKCIPEDECPLKCTGRHEVYNPCPITCPPQTCESIGQKYSCPAMADGIRNCQRACVCEDGFFRNHIGDCISEEDCLKCTGPNEFFSCGGACDNVCATLHKQSQKNCPIVNIKCNERCYCYEGYARDCNGTCIPIDECPLQCTKPNEEFDPCPPTCPARTCGKDDRLVRCAAPLEVGDPDCPPPACRCKNGFFRNKNGDCVTWGECPETCGQYEVYSNCTNGGCFGARKCCEKGQPERCVDLEEGACEEGCICIKGYLRDNNGVCIPEDQCPCTLKCTKPHEVCNSCPVTCPPQTCDSIGKVYHCPLNTGVCKEACVCVDGYYRNHIGECICKQDCLKCTGPNEYFSCGGACDNVCDTLDEQSQDNCPIINVKCNEMCYCDKGYARDCNNTCIPFDQCPPKTNKCGDHEIYSECIEAVCQNQKCCDRGKPEICKKPDNDCDCTKGCVCERGYLRNDDGDCIPEDQCDPQCGVNEYYDYCANGGCYGARNCSEIGRPTICVDLIEGGCRGGCLCNDKYLRDDDSGICIPQEQCPNWNTTQCDGPNEYYDDCPPKCSPQTCDSIGKKLFCPIQTQECKPSCRCIDNYFRNCKGICIPKDQCDEGICNGPNEYYDECPPSCPPQTCESIGKTYNCPIQPAVCKPACRCEDNYYRNRNNICVPKDECECTNVNNCGINEEFSTCVEGVCRNQNCTQRGEPVACPGLLPGACSKGCVCIENYLRGANGTCIPEDECDTISCQVNEEYSNCVQTVCRNQLCSRKGQPVSCLSISESQCIRGCICDENYLRAANGTCVPEDHCETCPEGEIYNKCPPEKCDAEYCAKSRDSPTACKSPKNCGPPRCTCGFNEKRCRDTGKCIPIRDCPPFDCDCPNEEYQSCPPVCPGESCEDYINKTKCPKYKIGIVVPCTPQCRCKKDFYRNSKGVCIAACHCKKETKPHCPNKDPPTDHNCGNGDNGPNCDNLEDIQQRFSNGITSFTTHFLKQVMATTDDSVIMSAFSVDVPLAELALYSGGDSKTQLLNAIGVSTDDEIRCVFKDFLQQVKAQQNVTFQLAARVYVNENYDISTAFSKDTEVYFEAEADTIDCSKPDQAADKINEWVEEQTDNLIQDIATPDMFTVDTRLVLVNAIHFKGSWLRQFNPDLTQKEDFHVTCNDVIQVDTMYQKGSFKYVESDELNAKFLEMPYVNGNFSCLFILPNEIDGLNKLVDDLQDTAKYDNALNKMEYRSVKVWMPIFEISTTIDLSKILPKVGVDLIFDVSTSNITGVLKKYEPLYVSAAIQKAFIKMNEQGSEAAAANVVVINTQSNVINAPEFNANHPYIFLLREGNNIIFSGAFRK